MFKRIFSLILLVTFLWCFCIKGLASTDAYTRLIDSLYENNINEAEQLIEEIINNDPESLQATLAYYLRIPLYTSYLTGCCMIYSSYYKAIENGFDVTDISIEPFSLRGPLLRLCGIFNNDLNDHVPSFFRDYSNDKNFDFNIKIPEEDKILWVSTNMELRYLERGIKPTNGLGALVDDIQKLYMRDNLLHINSLQSEDYYSRAKYFAHLAQTIGLGLIISCVTNDTQFTIRDYNICADTGLKLVALSKAADNSKDIEAEFGLNDVARRLMGIKILYPED